LFNSLRMVSCGSKHEAVFTVIL